ncbi:MAG: MarR family transcriptional regulator [Thermoleophilia bacterium]
MTTEPHATGAPSRQEATAEVLSALGEVFRSQRRLRGRDARHGGLTFSQGRLLAGLAEEDRRPASHLAADAGIGPASATEMIDALEALGLVTRERHTGDRRVVLVCLTSEGRRAVQERRDQLRAVFERALADLDPAELEAVPRVLRLVAQTLEEL